MQHPAPQKGAKPFLQRIQSAPPEGKEQVFQKSYVMGQELQKSYQLQGKVKFIFFKFFLFSNS